MADFLHDLLQCFTGPTFLESRGCGRDGRLCGGFVVLQHVTFAVEIIVRAHRGNVWLITKTSLIGVPF